MDMTIIQTALDRIRESQIHQGACLEMLIRGQATNYSRLEALMRRKANQGCANKCLFNSQPTKPSSFLGNIASTALTKWVVGAVIAVYLMKGGDALTLLQALLKAS